MGRDAQSGARLFPQCLVALGLSRVGDLPRRADFQRRRRTRSLGAAQVTRLCGALGTNDAPAGTFTEEEPIVMSQDVLEVLNRPLAQELLTSGIPARMAYSAPDG